MNKKADQYRLEIKDGDPPERVQTRYPRKMFEGALIEIAKQIRPGQYVEDLSAGSMGNVVTGEWLADHPEHKRK
ncbi:MAG: hypothetical protein ACLP59_05940 [Bryobacteraceae bacterium]